MKNPVLVCILLLAGCPAAHGQIILNAGDTYTYEFSSLPLWYTLSFGTLHSDFGFTVTPGTFDSSTDLLQWELFEDSPSGSPFHVDRYGRGGLNDSYSVPGAWLDLQGAIRFKMIAGSIGIDNFGMTVSVPPCLFCGWNTYQGFVTPLPASGLAGDFNADGTVDAADYVVWRKDLSATYSPADYDTWRAQFGQTVADAGATGSANGSAAIPEPASLLLAGLAVAILATRWTRSETRDGSLSNMGNIQ